MACAFRFHSVLNHSEYESKVGHSPLVQESHEWVLLDTFGWFSGNLFSRLFFSRTHVPEMRLKHVPAIKSQTNQATQFHNFPIFPNTNSNHQLAPLASRVFFWDPRRMDVGGDDGSGDHRLLSLGRVGGTAERGRLGGALAATNVGSFEAERKSTSYIIRNS